MYLDTDVILAVLKADDWLQRTVEELTFTAPKTSIITAVEVQLVMFDVWSRADLAGVKSAIEDEGIEVLPLTPEVFQAGADLLPRYAGLNVFDSIHLGHALSLDEPIVSTDTLYPTIDEITDLDPREL